MAEEFQESDVVFTGNTYENDDKYSVDSDSEESRRTKRKKIDTKKKKITKHEAVNIPNKLTWLHYVEPSLFEYENEEMVPPHVLLRRRLDEKMAFSVCSGIGRTLKGRDLSEMRNSVLRMTGFLET
ncbi:protein S40-3-like [Rutidosis leptorrhynchoides]|uniref:protein S40-3-like n=1 Tax=Rutidosis leptorrhynchoides TaxID=125765 RepID=UPI003A99DBD7